MKRVLFIVAALLTLNVSSRAQLMPSTVREIYDFAVGDTFEYYGWRSFFSAPYEYYRFHIVEDKRLSVGNDTVYYTFRLKEKRDYSNNHNTTYSETLEVFGYPNLDSFIIDIPQNDICRFTISGYCEQDDSVFIDTLKFIGKKINATYWGNYSTNGTISMFCEGLGEIYYSDFSEDASWPQGGYQLIYYHKANGEQWGTPYYFTISGVEEKQTIHASIFPNPANEQIEITVPADAVSKYENLLFSLYDVTGRNIYTQTVASEKSIARIAHLPQGIYYWRMASGNESLQQGRMVKQ